MPFAAPATGYRALVLHWHVCPLFSTDKGSFG